MSGIYGAANNRESINPDSFSRLKVWNEPYGQDVKMEFIGGNIAMGCCLEHFSNAPIPPAEVMSLNGFKGIIDAVIYNRDELMIDSSWGKYSDEEFLFQYCLKNGFSSLKNVNGDFCGAIYCEADRTVTLFRDHMGVRPLFYCIDSGHFVFSSDIRGIVAYPHIKIYINTEWLCQETSGLQTIGLEHTQYANVFAVRPACAITISIDTNSIVCKEQYWQLGTRKARCKNFEEYKSQLFSLINDSVCRRADVINGTIGAELSGGLDSGVIDILLCRHGKKCEFFSWSRDPELLPMAEGDERLIVQDICKQEGIDCHYIGKTYSIGAGTRMSEQLDKIGVTVDKSEHALYRCAFPAYIDTLPIYETSEYMHKNGVRVVFSGHGGDEGVSHRANAYEMFCNHEYVHYLKYFSQITPKGKKHFIRMMKECARNLLRYSGIARAKVSAYDFYSELVKEPIRRQHQDAVLDRNEFAYNPIKHINGGGCRWRMDTTALLGGFGGARYIFPYLDYRVIDFAVSIPRYLYRNGAANRYIFREAFKDIMPESLYVLTEKRNNSKKNYEKPAEDAWYIEMQNAKQFYSDRLDRDYWSAYLDFDVIDRFFESGKPETSEARSHDTAIMNGLNKCYLYQNLARKVGRKLE